MKIGALLTVRMKSTRLPGKAFSLIDGAPLINRALDSLVRYFDRGAICLCTTTDASDDVFVETAEAYRIQIYRGSELDVLDRLSSAAKLFDPTFTTFMPVTGDNPCVAYELVREVYDFHVKKNNDFTALRGVPWGSFFYMIERKALLQANRLAQNQDTEVWYDYLTQTGIFQTDIFTVSPSTFGSPDYRLTVDTEEDLFLMNVLARILRIQNKDFSFSNVVSILEKNPEICLINKFVIQKDYLPIKYDLAGID